MKSLRVNLEELADRQLQRVKHTTMYSNNIIITQITVSINGLAYMSVLESSGKIPGQEAKLATVPSFSFPVYSVRCTIITKSYIASFTLKKKEVDFIKVA